MKRKHKPEDTIHGRRITAEEAKAGLDFLERKCKASGLAVLIRSRGADKPMTTLAWQHADGRVAVPQPDCVDRGESFVICRWNTVELQWDNVAVVARLPKGFKPLAHKLKDVENVA